jgi:magnesium chelatase family protein
MLAKIYSAAVYGVDAYEVEIEVNGARGDPKIIIVGLPDAAVKESRDRVTTAISNSGYYWPRGRTTINLAPADIKKEGPSFDLPIALGMIAVAQELEQAPFETFSFVGELALDGAVRPVKGVLPVALEARRQKKEAIFVPAANAHEAAMVEGITVYGVRNLRETYQFVTRESLISPTYGDLTSFFATHKNYEVDFSDVKGQGHVKRAIEVAVAGGHNLLMLCNKYRSLFSAAKSPYFSELCGSRRKTVDDVATYRLRRESAQHITRVPPEPGAQRRPDSRNGCNAL